MKEYIPLTLSEFRQIEAGDRIICRIGDSYRTETVITGAYYNYDSDSPEWEIETLNGAFCCDCVYKAVAKRSGPKIKHRRPTIRGIQNRIKSLQEYERYWIVKALHGKTEEDRENAQFLANQARFAINELHSLITE